MIIGHLGTEDRAATEAAWHGAKAYDWYGVGDTGSDRRAKGRTVTGSTSGRMRSTLNCLISRADNAGGAGARQGTWLSPACSRTTSPPASASNTHDITHELDGRGELGFKRIAGFKGRSDNMVKLRGINLFPHAIAALIENRQRPDRRVCLPPGAAIAATQRDDMVVTIESRGGSNADALAALLPKGLNAPVAVELCVPEGTAAATQIDVLQKPIRLIDERGCDGGAPSSLPLKGGSTACAARRERG